MTREILEQLRERTAFKPSPPEFEMAAAYDAMCSDDEAFVIVQDEHFAKNHCWHHVPVPHIPPLRAKVAVDLGSDLTQLVSSSGWGGNPINGLLAIRDLAAAREARLVIVLDDTDTWAEGDETLALRARDFFVAVRAIAEVPEVTMFVAIQDHWAIETDGYVEPNTDAARAQYRALAERAARVLRVPLPRDVDQAHELIAAIIDRRVEITLDQTRAGGWTAALSTKTPSRC